MDGRMAHPYLAIRLLVAPDVPAVLLGQGVAAVDRIVTDGQALCQHACYLYESYFRLRS